MSASRRRVGQRLSCDDHALNVGCAFIDAQRPDFPIQALDDMPAAHPVAAYLARGVPLTDFGDPIDDPVILPPLAPTQLPDGSLAGEILHIDHFGNLITTIVPAALAITLTPGQSWLDIANQRAPLARTFNDVPQGDLLAYVGSTGHLEIAVRDGNAAARLGVDLTAPIRLIN